MTGPDFVKVIEKYGGIDGERVIALKYDNSGRTVFEEKPFSLSQMYDPEIESLVFHEKDGFKNPYISIKNVENIQGIDFAPDGQDINKYDCRMFNA